MQVGVPRLRNCFGARSSCCAQDDKEEDSGVRRQVRRLMTLIAIQNRLAGMKPSCAVLMPMMHMTTLFTVASSQPSQQRRPTRMVEVIVSTQDR